MISCYRRMHFKCQQDHSVQTIFFSMTKKNVRNKLNLTSILSELKNKSNAMFTFFSHDV